MSSGLSMIITQTPFRISFFGGGTDYPRWFLNHGGSTIVTTINKYCYIGCRTQSESPVSSQTADPRSAAVSTLLKKFGLENDVEISHRGDLPTGAGMGSSSALTVGLLKAIHCRLGMPISKRALAKAAISFEQNLMGQSVGSQDQISTAYGGLNQIVFSNVGDFSVSPIFLSPERKRNFEKHLLLFFTGRQRDSAVFAKLQIENLEKKASVLFEMQAIANEALSLLNDEARPMESLGKMLHASWSLKRTLAGSISTPEIDAIYTRGLAAGATGGKLLGAGGGGFFLFFAEPSIHERIKGALRELIHVPFRFETAGCQLYRGPSHSLFSRTEEYPRKSAEVGQERQVGA